jgi:hypothetical protein
MLVIDLEEQICRHTLHPAPEADITKGLQFSEPGYFTQCCVTSHWERKPIATPGFEMHFNPSQLTTMLMFSYEDQIMPDECWASVWAQDSPPSGPNFDLTVIHPWRQFPFCATCCKYSRSFESLVTKFWGTRMLLSFLSCLLCFWDYPSASVSTWPESSFTSSMQSVCNTGWKCSHFPLSTALLPRVSVTRGQLL